MENTELHSRVKEKLTECWIAYRDSLLQLQPNQIIDKAGEIAAARQCYDELMEIASSYPDHYLEHLLKYDDPLAAMREQWFVEQGEGYSDVFGDILWALWDHGPSVDDGPSMAGMS